MATPSGPEKTGYVSRLFGRIAPRYDLGNRVISLGRDQGWRRAAVKDFAPAAGERILDVGSGTGDLSIALAGSGASVTACDLSRPMMQVSASKAAAQGAPKIAHVLSDALRLPFTDEAFNGAAAAFTVRNFADLRTGLTEIARVLKPSGRFMCLEFTHPPSSLVGALYRPYLSHVLPILGGTVTGDSNAYRYLTDSIKSFPAPGSLADLMKASGFARVDWRLLNMGTVAIHICRKEPAGLN